MKKPQKTKTFNERIDIYDVLEHDVVYVGYYDSLEAIDCVANYVIKKAKAEGYTITRDQIRVFYDPVDDFIMLVQAKLKNEKYEEQLKEYEEYKNDQVRKLIDQLEAEGYKVTKK